MTEIVITGQISGNFKLRNAIITADCTERTGLPNAIILTFLTKKAAVNALSQGYRHLVNMEPEQKGRMGGIKYLRAHALAYDASRAVIE